MSNTRHRTITLAACCVAFFWALSSRAVLYASMPAVSLETGIAPATVGIITGTLYAGYSVAVMGSGYLPGTRRAVIASGFLLSAVANVLFACSSRASTMLVIVAIGGAGTGLYLGRGTAVLMETFARDQRGRAIGWHELAAAAALMVAPVYVGAVLPFVSWRAAVALWSVVGVGAAAVVWRWVPDAPASTGPTARFLPLDARIPLLACLGGACLAIMSGFFTMLPTLVARGWDVSPAEAASFTGWTRASGFAGAALGGYVVDRLPRQTVLAAAYAVMLAGIAAFAVLDYGVAFGAVIMIITVAATAGATAYYAQLGDAFRPVERERAFGAVAAAAGFISMVATPVGLGFALDALSARAALVALAAAPLLGFGVLGAWHRVSGPRTP